MFNFNDNENEEKPKSKTKEAIGQFLKAHWKKLPLAVKLQIIGGVIGALSLIMIPVLAFIVLNSVNFLFYSDGVQNENKEVDEAYEEYWDQLCKENSKDCTEEQKKAAEKLQKDQAAFYERLDKLAESHLSKNSKDKKEQRYIILTTVFYGYGIDDLTEGTAFELDESGNDDMTVTADEKSNAYVEEKDTLKELVKQFKVSVPKCYYDSVDSDGNATRPGIEIKNGDESFAFNFFDKFSFNLGLYKNEEYEKAQEEQCYKRYNGLNPKPQIEEVNGGEPSVAAFYKYLKTSEYLDKKVHLESIYMNYAKSNDLSQDITSWPEEEKIKVRETIIEDIKDIVEEAMKEEDRSMGLAYGIDVDYWWPIGSKETTKVNGKLFAKDDPVYTGITSDYGERTGEFAGFHHGIDLEAWNGDYDDTAYIIASRSGTVERAFNTCAPFTPNSSCGYGWGNHVLITDIDGKQQNYAHLSKVYVQAGEKVEQGQVIGKAGNSGDSGAVHLHFEMWVNGDRVNPIDYIDPKKPRPEVKSINVSKDMNKLIALVDCLEGVTGGSADENGMYTVMWGEDGVFTVGHGVVLEYNKPGFAKYGIDANKYMFTGAKIPKVIVDNVRTDVIMQGYDDINKALIDNKIVLDFDQISALISFKYNWGSINDFIPVYKKYGNSIGLRDNFFLHPSNIGSSPGSIYYGGHTTRRNDEWQLFHNHVWRCYGNELKFD